MIAEQVHPRDVRRASRTFGVVYVRPGLVVSMFPPASAARSMVTEPGFIESIMTLEMSLGAGLPAHSTREIFAGRDTVRANVCRQLQEGGGHTRDKSGGDDYVDFLALLCKELHLSGDEFRRHFLRITSSTAAEKQGNDVTKTMLPEAESRTRQERGAHTPLRAHVP